MTFEVVLSKKKTLFLLLSRFTNNLDVLQLIYSWVIDTETKEAQMYHSHSLFIRELRLYWNDYDICSPNLIQFKFRLPDKRGLEWAIKNSDKLSQDISRGNIIDIIQLLGIPGLFITRVKDPETDIITNQEVRSVHQKIRYINLVMKDDGWGDLCDDHDTYSQTGIPIEIN